MSEAEARVQRHEPATSSRFVNATFRNVKREWSLLGLPLPTSVAMVGCGAYPTTLLFLRGEGIGRIVGIDSSIDALGVAERLLGRSGGPAVELWQGSGEDYDFSSHDVVFVGNVISRKRQVLEQILRTGSSGVRVVARTPASGGALCFEQAGALEPHWRKVAEAPMDRTLLCRSIVLRRGGGAFRISSK